MKKLALAVATLSLSTAAFAQDAPAAATGQIKFIGQVTDGGCTIVTGNQATIDLGSMPKTVLAQKPSQWTHGQIKFEDCTIEAEDEKLPAVKLTILPGVAAGSVVQADGTFKTDDANKNLWENDGNAKGVGIEVTIAGNGPAVPVLPLVGTEKPVEADIIENVATYDVRGRMVNAGKEDATPGVGSVEATLKFIAEYQ